MLTRTGTWKILKSRGTMNKTIANRKAKGLCIDCGTEKAAVGKVRCESCLKYHREHARIWREGLTEDQKHEMYEKNRKWLAEHPEKADIYRERYEIRRIEYNRRYREKNPTRLGIYRERWLNWDGERVRMSELAKRYGIKYHTLYTRLYRDRRSLREALLM